MSIRRIKAHGAVEEGDYIRIEKRSTWPYWLFIGLIVGYFVGTFILNNGLIHITDSFTVVGFSMLFFSVIGLLMGNEKEVRRVPKVDLVEIKRYASGHVTVVLDDERVKGQSRWRG